jgi:hypothetical protein
MHPQKAPTVCPPQYNAAIVAIVHAPTRVFLVHFIVWTILIFVRFKGEIYEFFGNTSLKDEIVTSKLNKIRNIVTIRVRLFPRGGGGQNRLGTSQKSENKRHFPSFPAKRRFAPMPRAPFSVPPQMVTTPRPLRGYAVFPLVGENPFFILRM